MMAALNNQMCRNSHSVKADPPLFLMNAFVNGSISKSMTKNGYYDVFKSNLTGSDCAIKSCKLLKPGCT